MRQGKLVRDAARKKKEEAASLAAANGSGGVPMSETPFARLTTFADRLMQQGFAEVYTETREELSARLAGGKGMGVNIGDVDEDDDEDDGSVPDILAGTRKRAAPAQNSSGESAHKRPRTEAGGGIGSAAAGPVAGDHYIRHPAGCTFYYRRTATESQEHGPFTLAQMRGWRAQGYFLGESAVLLRRANPPFPSGGSTAVGGGGSANGGGGGDLDDLMGDLADDDDDDDDDAGGSADGKVWVNSSTIRF